MFNARKKSAAAANGPGVATALAPPGVAKFTRGADAATTRGSGGTGSNGNVARVLLGDAFRGSLEATPAYVEAKVRLHQRLLDMINLPAIERMKPEEFRAGVAELVREL